ncbi:Hypothetical predicted protein [Olea europaea subsp. europaea]|uniref:Uncharacterized protein n=1 Tax=Olea europaea subsp. europaea TaxID=158383 RepID=A0A8S0SDH6_OLEEU|nr:Hypothetical predicted protein [Olea europaea subsp. europaea]CAA2989733.1 Hypothetical predicted protein [Olea europaea subsp. europaea]
MDEIAICVHFFDKSAGTISGIGPAPRKSYINTCTTPGLMEKLEILAQRDKEKDDTFRELTQRLEQHALLIQSLVARIDMSQHPPRPNNDPPPPPSSVSAIVL